MSTVMPKNSPSVASRNSSMSFMFRRSPNGLVRSQNVRHTAVAADRHGVETFATTSRHHALVLPANSPTIHCCGQPIRRGGDSAISRLGFDPVVPGNRGGVLPGFDFRGQGGYIVTPPSVHPTGVCYRWIIRDDLGTAPSWLVDLVGPERAVNGSKELRVSSPTTYGRAALRR
jgi:hypothetical protein